MNHLYQISISEVIRLTKEDSWAFANGVVSEYADNEKKVKEHLSKTFAKYVAGANVDGEELKNLFFPTDLANKFDLFISHSYADKDEVERLAKVLEAYGYHCFVDWMVWGNLKDLQHTLDNNLCNPVKKDKGGISYDYMSRNYTTAHTHAMLSMALFDMIDKCDICLFITSNNSTLPNANFGDLATLSPWIYEEVTFMNSIAHIKERKMFSEGGEVVRITHPLDLSHFKTLTAHNLISSLQTLND